MHSRLINLLLTIGVSFSLLPAFAQTAYQYRVNTVSEGIYQLEPTGNDLRWVTANIIVIVNDADVLVVDSGLTPSAAESAIREIRKLTSKPVRYLVNTHWHGDHWQGNEAFVAAWPGLEIIACEQGYNGILRNGMVWVRKFYQKYLQLMIDNYEADLKKGTNPDGKKFTEAEIAQLREGIQLTKSDLEEIKKLHPTPPTMTFQDKMALKRGSREIQLHYLGWGNTVGDAVIYLPNEKILIPGDLVVYPSPYESGSFSKEWLETSRKLKDFEFRYLIPGHGKVLTDASYLDYLNALFAETIRQINAAYEQGINVLDEAQKVVTNESVVSVLSKDARYAEYVKQLDPGFVPAAVKSAFQKSRESKL
jgi:glyoxylase-like metal-dependent hydrolase (beta-lactamase superfamily II)